MVDAPIEEETKESTSKRKRLLLITTSVFILIGLFVALYWLFVWRFEEYTDDAYVNGNMVQITPQVAGIVTSVNVDNTDFVEEGQVLIELDKTDNFLAFKQSENDLAMAVRSVVQMFLKVEELEATLEAKDAELIVAEQDYANRVNLVDIGAVSVEEFEHVEATLKSARASAKETYHSLQAAYAEVQGTSVSTHPLVLEAIERVKSDWISLKRCSILSPVTGYVAQRSAQLGEWVNLAQPLMAIIPLNELWVDANFKETKLASMRIGQDATIRSDIYGRAVTFKGKVVGINPGTGSVFSALPPQNATGNWIKIVQRVPVRISLNRKQVEKNPLWLGLSMEVTVDIQDKNGEMLAESTRSQPIYRTEIYSRQEEGIEKVIRAIIEANGGGCGRGT